MVAGVRLIHSLLCFSCLSDAIETANVEYLGVVPAIHFFVTDNIRVLIDEASLHWLLLMGLLYLIGAALYASRTPERCFPGKCDLLVRDCLSLSSVYLIFVFLRI